MKDKILFISFYNFGYGGLSGGDRIFIELINGWKEKISVGIMGTKECLKTFQKYHNTKNIETFILNSKLSFSKKINNIHYLLHSINCTFLSIKSIFRYKKSISKYKYIYSASDFYPDTIPAFLIKLFFKDKIWIASFYLFAPKPWQKNNPYKTSFSRFITGTLYWLTQKLTFFIVYYFADYVFVTSKPDVAKFISSKRNKNKIIIIKGGVDTAPSKNFIQKTNNFKYLAVFIGRLHHQKGVLELIDIWKNVYQLLPSAKLAIIGNGQLIKDVKYKILKNKLKNNIELFGFLDGKEKFNIFKTSRIVVHPAIYDSGGMAAAEAMAWGLPGVSFDLKALKTYYPKGMVKTKCFDLQEFAKNIIKLSQNQTYYKKMSEEAKNLIETKWSWKIRCQEIYNQVFILNEKKI
ncbi:MAG: glycosyltransferase [Candidatus Shapirobacteria bacterium]|jgi:glycosyltransferase involved in cell wall biosynthesis